MTAETRLMAAVRLHGGVTIDPKGAFAPAARALAKRGLIDYQPATGVVRRTSKEG